ncbi:MAG: hypothetical protein ABSC23_17365 [Bryobacteraceae bacterium]|jgi:hypothetical protein
MPKSLKIGKIKLSAASIRDPRVAMRSLIWALVSLNLMAAVAAFQPFGGSGEGLRREETTLGRQLVELQKRVQAGKGLVDKVELARREGDQFMEKYVMDARTYSSTLGDELNRDAKEAGIRPLPSQTQLEPIEGSDTLYMATVTAGYEGTYAGIKKYVELLDKSPRFLIIETMAVASPQTGQLVNVSLKLDAFVRNAPGAAL